MGSSVGVAHLFPSSGPAAVSPLHGGAGVGAVAPPSAVAAAARSGSAARSSTALEHMAQAQRQLELTAAERDELAALRAEVRSLRQAQARWEVEREALLRAQQQQGAAAAASAAVAAAAAATTTPHLVRASPLAPEQPGLRRRTPPQCRSALAVAPTTTVRSPSPMMVSPACNVYLHVVGGGGGGACGGTLSPSIAPQQELAMPPAAAHHPYLPAFIPTDMSTGFGCPPPEASVSPARSHRSR